MNGELIPTNQQDAPLTVTLTDLRHMTMMQPIADQNTHLEEYRARRANFRQWLMKQLVEGTHYGIVPGCEPKMEMRVPPGGTSPIPHYGIWNKKANGGKGRYDFYPETQWRPKPSLYAAGADFICDLLGVRDEYETDTVGWEQMGSKAGTSVQKCRLYSRETGALVGEAIGAASHQYDANNAIKMASKCAKVGAVINAYGLRDLFTQDAPPPTQPVDNPAFDSSAPKADPRASRRKIGPNDIAQIARQWKAKFGSGDDDADRQDFKTWALEVTNRQFEPGTVSSWTAGDVDLCEKALRG